MRAVGFYRRATPEESAALLESARLGPSLDSLLPPAEAIDLYCRRNDHQLADVFAPPSGDSNVDWGETLDDRYARLVSSFTGPDARPALVVIPDATHLAGDLETVVARLLELRELGSDVRCATPDRPDPLQSALEQLGLEGRSPERQRRIRDAIMSKASRGEVLGRTPYGYSAGVDGTLKPVPDEAAVVADVFKWYAGPWYAPGSKPLGGDGLRRIAQRLNDQVILTRSGRPWTQVSVAGILRNRAYLGTYSRYGVRIVGSHEPLVEREIFNRAEVVMESRRPRRGAAADEPFLLGGLGRCGVCGRGMFGLTRRRKWRRKDRSRIERAYRYYECPSRQATRERDRGTGHPAWRAQDLEDAVRRQLLSLPPDTFDLRPDPKAEHPEGPRKGAISAAERGFMRAARAVASGYGDLADLRGPLELLQAARTAPLSEPEHVPLPSELLAVATSDNPVEARDAIKTLVERLVVTAESVEVIPRSA